MKLTSKIIKIYLFSAVFQTASANELPVFGDTMFFPDILNVFDDMKYQKVSDSSYVIDLSKIEEAYARDEMGEVIRRKVKFSQIKIIATTVVGYFSTLNSRNFSIIDKFTDDETVINYYVEKIMLSEIALALEAQPFIGAEMKLLYPFGAGGKTFEAFQVFRIDHKINDKEIAILYLSMNDMEKIANANYDYEIFAPLLKK